MARSKLASKPALALVGVLALIGISSSAHATPNFPDVVASHLGLEAPPDCTLCHIGTPARGTVTTPFGATLRSRGAQAYDEAALRRALDALTAERKDSDSDGTPDIDELRAADDPNSGAGGPAVTPDYGCTAAPGRGEAPLYLAVMLLAGLVIGVCRARTTNRR